LSLSNNNVIGLKADINLNPDGKSSNGKVTSEADCIKSFYENAPDDEKSLTIVGHGGPNAITDDRKEGGGALDAEDLAELIRGNEDFKNGKITRILLYSCSTGKGVNPIAEQLAKLLKGIEVYAPTELFWPCRNGKYDICKCVVTPSGKRLPIYNQKGEMKRFFFEDKKGENENPVPRNPTPKAN